MGGSVWVAQGERRVGFQALLKAGGIFVLGGLIRVDVADPDSGPSRAEAFGLELAACQAAQASGKPEKCRLFGKIQFVTAHADVKVEVVDAFPDIKVQRVTAFADDPGEWEIVEHFPDYKVEVVSAFPDYKIQYVDAFPGCN